MAEGLGLTGLLIAIGAIFIPMVSLFVVWLALLCVTVSALAGDRMFSIATLVLSVMNVLFWSPYTLLILIGEHTDNWGTTPNYGSPILLIITLIMFAAPVVAIILNSTGKLVLDRPDRAHRVVLGR